MSVDDGMFDHERERERKRGGKRKRERKRPPDRQVTLESGEFVGQDVNEIINAPTCPLMSRLVVR